VSDLNVVVAFHDGITLDLSGTVDHSLEAIVTNILDTLAADGEVRRRLVIDLRDVAVVDDVAVRALERADRCARRRGFRVDLRSPDPNRRSAMPDQSTPTSDGRSSADAS
jgi:anti-anti-sigma regulatory factor